MYDIIIVWAGASGLMCSIFAPKNAKKLIIEKTPKIATKVFLSWGERCNFSNMYIDIEEDYFGENKKFLFSVFSKFSNYDMIDFLEKNGVKSKIEEHGRILLDSNKSTDMIELLIDKVRENDAKLELNTELLNLQKKGNVFYIKTSKWDYQTKKLVIATWWRSFPQIGTTGDAYRIAEGFDINLLEPYKGLCGVTTKKDLSSLSGSSVVTTVVLWDKEEKIYSQTSPLLFTHWGLSGPCIFNTTLKLWEYLRSKWIKAAQEDEYIRDNIKVSFQLEEESTSKKLKQFFPIEEEIFLEIQNIRGWKEAKVTGGGVLVDEITASFESKKVPWLYFIWESLDITGKTGGYNLQFAWSSGYICGKGLSI